MAPRDDDVTARLLAAAQGRAGAVLRPQPAGWGLQLWWMTPGPGWAAQGCHQGSGSGAGGRLWSPEHLICSGRADSSPEPACEGMCGNPTLAVVPRLCKVRIVLRLPACSSCHRLLSQGSWKSLAIQPSQHGRLLIGHMLCRRGWEREGSSCWVHMGEHQDTFSKSRIWGGFVAAALRELLQGVSACRVLARAQRAA